MSLLTKLVLPTALIALPGLIGLTFAPEAAAAPTPEPKVVNKAIKLNKPTSLGNKWKRVVKVAYGSSAPKLGTSLGGDGQGIKFGPSYGTQTPDKTWWIADAAKKRLAHYSSTGKYLGQVKLPKKYLHSGYFQWQFPFALSNGSVVLSSTTIDSPALLRMSRTGAFTKVKMRQTVAVLFTDGKYLYGFNEKNKKVRVDPNTGKIIAVTWFQGQGGHKFQISARKNYLTVKRPGVTLKIKLVSAEYPKRDVHPGVQAVMGKDGKLWILVNGAVELPNFETANATGLFSITKGGKISPVLNVRRLSGGADPGDGQNLGIRHGSKLPWLMFIDTTALRVYRLK